MASVKVLRNELDIVITCDPAISEKAQACRTAVTCMGMTPYTKIFMLEYWVGRQGDPLKVIQTILDMAYRWQPRLIGIESVGYQQALEPFIKREMESRGEHYTILMLKPDRLEKKNQRILSMQPYFRTGQIYIQRGMFELIEEYESFPMGRTCDILDSMSYAVRLLVPQKQTRAPSVDMRLKELAKEDPMSARYWRAHAIKRGVLEAEQTIDDVLDDTQSTSWQPGIGELV